MDQETLVQGLRERTGENSFSDKTFEAAAQSVLPLFADDSKITDETWNIPVGILKGLNGQYNADVANSINQQKEKLLADNKVAQEKWQSDFKAKWEKDHQPQTPPPSSQTPPSTPPANGAEGDAVKKALDAYNERLFGKDGKSGLIGGQLAATSDFIKQSKAQAEEAKANAVRKELKEYLISKGASVKRDALLNYTVKAVNIGEGFDIDKAKLDIEKTYQQNYKEFYGDGGKPFGGDSVGGAEGGADESLKKYLEGKQKEAQNEAAAAENLRKKFK